MHEPGRTSALPRCALGSILVKQNPHTRPACMSQAAQAPCRAARWVLFW
ncbi:hypothetical protein BLL52_0460 [Rhodoferax antarcticus ANT.BR]|uniref:Uncharacterized protein n=1 Tax=Rhodoferax antarcticus ANT.BR TaxID=1111071 RepID=A0A1Q8YJI6_9BURK|nr:hypothetical protein BLL52_0460 [Rhodoferax antarcticus ANT.BR]